MSKPKQPSERGIIISLILIFILFIAFLLFFTLIMQSYNIPFYSSDLVYGSLSISLIFYFIKNFKKLIKAKTFAHKKSAPYFLKKNLSNFLILLLVIAMAIFCIKTGYHEPMVYHNNHKAAFHGYTLFLMGLVLLLLSFISSIKMVLQIKYLLLKSKPES